MHLTETIRYRRNEKRTVRRRRRIATEYFSFFLIRSAITFQQFCVNIGDFVRNDLLSRNSLNTDTFVTEQSVRITMQSRELANPCHRNTGESNAHRF